MSRSKPKPKHRSPSHARRLRAARRYRLDPTEKIPDTTVFLSLRDSEIKGLEKLAHRNGTTLGVELHRAIDAHLQSAGQPSIQLLNAFLARFNAALDRNNQALEKLLHKAMKTRTRS